MLLIPILLAAGFTMTLQRTLFTQLPIQFQFPLDLVGQTLLIALACAIISSYFPARALMRNSVSSVMRTVL
jgi:ABC-type antimicrobial peptide transport system permease subunit